MKKLLLLMTALVTGSVVASQPSATNQTNPLPAAAVNSTAEQGWVWWDALGAVETGGNDAAVGPHREVSRYQVLPSVWRRWTRLPLSAAQNVFTAHNIGVSIMASRADHFAVAHGRRPTPREEFLLWHCPAHVSRPTQREKTYADQCVSTLEDLLK